MEYLLQPNKNIKGNRQANVYNHYPQGQHFFLDGNKKHFAQPLSEI